MQSAQIKSLKAEANKNQQAQAKIFTDASVREEEHNYKITTGRVKLE